MIFITLVLGLLPGFVWLFFYLQEDRENPEPKWLLALVFAGGFFVTVPTVILESFSRDFLRSFGFSDFSAASFATLAFIEEAAKLLIAYLIIRRSREFDEPIDAMVYIVTAAMGFATAENIAVNSGLISGLGAKDLAATSLIVGNLLDVATRRFVGATLLHSLSSGIIGYHWALGIIRKKMFAFIASGLVMGTLLHAIFNYLIIRNINIVFPTILLMVTAFFVLNDFEKLKINN